MTYECLACGGAGFDGPRSLAHRDGCPIASGVLAPVDVVDAGAEVRCYLGERAPAPVEGVCPAAPWRVRACRECGRESTTAARGLFVCATCVENAKRARRARGGKPNA